MRLSILLYFTLQLGLIRAQTFNLNLDYDLEPDGYSGLLSQDENILVVGTSSNFDLSSDRLVFSAFNFSGLNQIELIFGEEGFKYNAGSIISDNLNGYFIEYQIVDTSSNEFFFHDTNISLFRIDQDGIVLWNKYLGDSVNAEAAKSMIFENDTLYMTGFRNYQSEQHTSTFLYKISPTGDSLALFTYGHPDWNFIGNKIIRAQNGDFLIAGYAMDGFERDRLLLRIAPNGDLLWYQIYPGEDYIAGTYDAFMDIIELEDGNLIAGGRYTDYLYQNANLVKLNAAGEIIWDMSWGEESNDWFEAMALRNDTLFLGGNWRSGFESGYIDAWITAMDTAGNVYWSHTYNPDGIPDNAADDYLYDFTL
ncbi:MAG: hypothetical protein WAT52_12775, partial [Chitinophagales bacterium]